MQTGDHEVKGGGRQGQLLREQDRKHIGKEGATSGTKIERKEKSKVGIQSGIPR